MELQWPLILFTTLVAWSAGLFGTQCLLSLDGRGSKAQMPALVTSIVLLALGGIAVFFHLEHWERIFNGFGHITSGITQELIMIVVFVVVAVAYFVCLRKGDEESVPKGLAVVGIIVSVVLVAVMAHSYLMAARPSWDTVAWVLYLIGNACVLGPVTFGVVAAVRSESAKPVLLPAIIGSAVNLVTAVAYAACLHSSGSAFVEIGHYFDPTHPTAKMLDASAASLSSPDQTLLVVGGAIVVGSVVPLICSLAMKKAQKPSFSLVLCLVSVIAAVVGAVAMRVAFYNAGLSVFMLY